MESFQENGVNLQMSDKAIQCLDNIQLELYQKKQVIYEKGQQPVYFYILCEGEIELYEKNSDDIFNNSSEQERVYPAKTIYPGFYFGHYQLLYQNSAHFTAICNKKNSYVLKVERSDFMIIFGSYFKEQLQQIHTIFEKYDIVKNQHFIKFLQLIQTLEFKEFRKSTFVYKEGDIADYAYVIIQGEIEISTKQNKSDNQQKDKENNQQKQLQYERLGNQGNHKLNINSQTVKSYGKIYGRKSDLQVPLFILNNGQMFGHQEFSSPSNRDQVIFRDHAATCRSIAVSLYLIPRARYEKFMEFQDNKIVQDSPKQMFEAANISPINQQSFKNKIMDISKISQKKNFNLSSQRTPKNIEETTQEKLNQKRIRSSKEKNLLAFSMETVTNNKTHVLEKLKQQKQSLKSSTNLPYINKEYFDNSLIAFQGKDKQNNEYSQTNYQISNQNGNNPKKSKIFLDLPGQHDYDLFQSNNIVFEENNPQKYNVLQEYENTKKFPKSPRQQQQLQQTPKKNQSGHESIINFKKNSYSIQNKKQKQEKTIKQNEIKNNYFNQLTQQNQESIDYEKHLQGALSGLNNASTKYSKQSFLILQKKNKLSQKQLLCLQQSSQKDGKGVQNLLKNSNKRMTINNLYKSRYSLNSKTNTLSNQIQQQGFQINSFSHFDQQIYSEPQNDEIPQQNNLQEIQNDKSRISFSVNFKPHEINELSQNINFKKPSQIFKIRPSLIFQGNKQTNDQKIKNSSLTQQQDLSNSITISTLYEKFYAT